MKKYKKKKYMSVIVWTCEWHEGGGSLDWPGTPHLRSIRFPARQPLVKCENHSEILLQLSSLCTAIVSGKCYRICYYAYFV